MRSIFGIIHNPFLRFSSYGVWAFDGKDIAELLYLSLSESTEATDGIIVFVHGEEREARCIQPHHATAGFHSVATVIPAKFSQSKS